MKGPFGDGGRGRSRVALFPLLLILSVIASAPAISGQCKLGQIAEFPVTMVGLSPLMSANIDGTDVKLVVDSGGFYSLMSAGSASELKLKISPAPHGFYLTGAGRGAVDVSIGTVTTFTIAGVPLHKVEFLVGGSETGQGSAGVLGLNFLNMADAEYDLGQGVVRLMKADGCGKAMLAYWVKAAAPYSVMDTVPEPQVKISHIIGTAYLNGTQIRVLFDTGAGASIISLEAAARAGIKASSPGVVRGGTSNGIGRGNFATFIGPFASFKIGDEEIKNTRLRFGDIHLDNTDMLIGADFFLSHRIYVANSQHKVYFTYNGGPVFNLTTDSRSDNEAAADVSPQELSHAGAATEDAAGYARRGAAFASRREFEQALTALTRACELAPDNPEYFYTRGTVYLQNKQPDLAMADFGQALKLKPNYLEALIAHAQLSLGKGDRAGADADLAAADAVAPKEADIRFQMAGIYERADRLEPSVAQLTLWIDSHAADARLPAALNARCRFRALAGVDLPLALKDCDAALKSAEKSTPWYSKVSDSRALVYLRMGDYDKSITDYNAALQFNARNAWSLYGRGIAKLRSQQVSEANADFDAAKMFGPGVAEEFSRRGIVP
jgi:tetratricopeptide (TPR) repeat protein/predicted aspartyl protease